jgi:hypothetical protein
MQKSYSRGISLTRNDRLACDESLTTSRHIGTYRFFDECIDDNALSEVVFPVAIKDSRISFAHLRSLPISPQLRILRPGLPEDRKIGVGGFP